MFSANRIFDRRNLLVRSAQWLSDSIDVGNSTDKDRDVIQEILALGKRNLICEFHFKDGDHLLSQGPGRIDFKKVRDALDDIDYSGWLQLETPAPNGLVPDYAAQCKYLRTLFPSRL